MASGTGERRDSAGPGGRERASRRCPADDRPPRSGTRESDGRRVGGGGSPDGFQLGRMVDRRACYHTRSDPSRQGNNGCERSALGGRCTDGEPAGCGGRTPGSTQPFPGRDGTMPGRPSVRKNGGGRNLGHEPGYPRRCPTRSLVDRQFGRFVLRAESPREDGREEAGDRKAGLPGPARWRRRCGHCGTARACDSSMGRHGATDPNKLGQQRHEPFS